MLKGKQENSTVLFKFVKICSQTLPNLRLETGEESSKFLQLHVDLQSDALLEVIILRWVARRSH